VGERRGRDTSDLDPSLPTSSEPHIEVTAHEDARAGREGGCAAHWKPPAVAPLRWPWMSQGRRRERLIFDGVEVTWRRREAEMVKALVWFWIIDKTLVLTFMLSVCRLNEVGTCQVMEQEMIMVMMVMTTR